MSVRRVVWPALALSLVASGMFATSTQAEPSTATTGSAGHVLRVRGTIQHLAADSMRGPAATRTFLVRGPRHYELSGLHTTLLSGDVVVVTGVPTGERLAVQAVQVVRAARPVSERSRGHGVTKAIVVPVYWTAHPPKKPTRSQLQSRILAYSRAWFHRVSNGRYSVKGSVAPWVKISRPPSCSDFFTVERNVYQHMRMRGINPDHYGRVIAYLPCSDGYLAGQASLPGKTVELYSNTTGSVVTHEQGHNLGLDHAASLTCAKHGRPTVRDGRCTYSEYGDDSDDMGALSAGFYSAPRRAALGWLRGLAQVGHTATKTLVPYESRGGGLHAVKVRAGHSTYWLEYRTQTSFDRGLTDGDVGLQIRIPGPGLHTRQLDLLPLRSTGYYTRSDGTALADRGSWQTSEGVRFTVTKMSAGQLTVSIDYHPGKRGKPTAPRTLGMTPKLNAVNITWRPPASSKGSPITAYRIGTVGSKHTKTVSAGSALVTTVNGLKATQTYRFTISARNELGWGAAVTTGPTQPLSGPPTASLQAPDTAFGTVQLYAYGTPDFDSHAPITSTHVLVDGQPAGTKISSDVYAVDTTTLTDGEHTFAVTVTDSLGKTDTASQQVTVTQPGLMPQSPLPGATVSDTGTISYTLVHAEVVSQVEADVDGSYLASTYQPVDGVNTLSDVYYSYLTDGPHTLQLVASSADGACSLTVSIPITVSNSSQ